MDWDTYIDELEKGASRHGIAVIGVTDYMSIEGYCRLRDETAIGSESRLSSVFMLLPNIEFRINPSTASGKAFNIHLLIDPSSSDHIMKIRRALNNLKVDYSGEKYGCSEEQLKEFGRAYMPGCVDDNEALSVGIKQFKPDFSKWKEWYLSESWLKDNSLVAVANGKDGISGLPSDGFGAIREELLTLANVIFSGNPNDRAHFLGERVGLSRDDVERMYGTRKPCLHGSDAHDIESLFQPDQQRSCWIKADPTFEGLKQILQEPEDRVWIGPTKPQQTDENRVISEVRLSGGNDWFETPYLPLNEGLVAIIGEKGSGKTALADLIAFAAGEPMLKGSQSSFIAKAKSHINGYAISLNWKSGVTTSGTLVQRPHDVERPLVRYLTQDFVEQLCSADHQGGQLYEAIEEIVFSHLDNDQREGASSFSELRQAREGASRIKRDSIRGQIATLNAEIERIQYRLAQRPVKEAQRTQERIQLAELQKQLPAASRDMDQQLLKNLDTARSRLKSLEGKIDLLTSRQRTVEQGLAAYDAIRVRASKEIASVINILLSEDALKGLLSDEQVESLMPRWSDKAEALIREKASNIHGQVKSLQGDVQLANMDGSTRADVAKLVLHLEASLEQDEQKQKRLVDLQKQMVSCEKTIDRLSKELDDLAAKVSVQLEKKSAERDDLYHQYFASLVADEVGLQELYEPMKRRLIQRSQGVDFELAIGNRVDIDSWWDRAKHFFDNRKSDSQQKREELEAIVFDRLNPAWNSGRLETIKSAHSAFIGLLNPEVFLERFAVPSLKPLELFDWIYSTDHVEASYRILYNGTELEHLSPGARGIALLVLYLLMDEDDRRPLIIDQPEGNLDSASVYKQLVPYIREAKGKRQIILVTHNPNLVVATDADQVVIAKATRSPQQSFPRISYECGSLENIEKDGREGVRDQVCTILEGGPQAFRERQGRYSLTQP